MAVIRNTFTIVDNATATLRRVQTQTQSVVKAFQNLDSISKKSTSFAKVFQQAEKHTKKVDTNIKAVAKSVQSSATQTKAMTSALEAADAVAEQLAAHMNLATAGTAGAAGAAANAAQGLDTDASTASTAGGKFNVSSILSGLGKAKDVVGTIKEIAGGIADKFKAGGELFLTNLNQALELVKKIYDYVNKIGEDVDFVRSMQGRLEILGPSGTDGTVAFRQLLELSNKTYSSIEQTSNIVSRSLSTSLFDSAEDLGAAFKFAELLNKSLVATGASASAASSAIEQLMQGLGAGQLYWQDLRIILQQAPGLAKILAEGLNKVNPELEATVGSLRDLTSEGELTAANIVAAFNAMEDEINEMFGQFPRLFSQLKVLFENLKYTIMSYLGETGAAFDTLITKIEAFADWLTKTEEGIMIIGRLTAALELFVTAITWALDGLGRLYNFLIEHTYILLGVLGALGITALLVAGQMIIAFLATAWPLLLIIALIALCARHLMSTGLTAVEVARIMTQAFLTFVFRTWNIALGLLQFVLNALTLVHNAWIALRYGIEIVARSIYVAILELASGAAGAFSDIIGGLASFAAGAANLIGSVVEGIWTAISSVAQGVASLLSSIGNTAFGSFVSENLGIDLAGAGAAVSGAISAMDPGAAIRNAANSAAAGVDAIAQELKKTEARLSVEAYRQGQLIDTAKNNSNLRQWDPVDLSGLAIKDPVGSASEWTDKIFNTLEDALKRFSEGQLLDTGDLLSELGDILNQLENNDPNGSNVGSVGKINEDVNISDEDIKLLRDIAAREFLLSLSQVTPTVNVSFGDVRETADVNQLMDTIADMMEESLATSLVYNN